MIAQYRIKPTGFDELKPLLYSRMAIVQVCLIAAVAAWQYFSNGQRFDQTGFIVLGITVLIQLGTTVYTLKRQRVIFQSYTLTVTPERLLREQQHVLPIEVPVAGIRSITRNRNGSLSVRSQDLNRSIDIPAQLTDLPTLEAYLAALHPIGEHPVRLPQEKLALALPAVMLAAAITLFAVNHKLVVALAGFTAVSLLIWSTVFVQRSRHIDRQIKKTQFSTYLVILFLLITTITKLLR